MLKNRTRFLQNGLIGGAIVGALYGLCRATGGVLNSARRASVGADSLVPRSCGFLHDNYEMSSILTRLHALLSIEAPVRGLDDAFGRLCHQLDFLLGFERLVETPSGQLPLHVNYTASLVATRANQILDEWVEREFRIPALGRDICECIEKIQKLVKDAQTNIMHDFSMRITSLHRTV